MIEAWPSENRTARADRLLGAVGDPARGRRVLARARGPGTARVDLPRGLRRDHPAGGMARPFDGAARRPRRSGPRRLPQRHARQCRRADHRGDRIAPGADRHREGVDRRLDHRQHPARAGRGVPARRAALPGAALRPARRPQRRVDAAGQLGRAGDRRCVQRARPRVRARRGDDLDRGRPQPGDRGDPAGRLRAESAVLARDTPHVLRESSAPPDAGAAHARARRGAAGASDRSSR